MKINFSPVLNKYEIMYTENGIPIYVFEIKGEKLKQFVRLAMKELIGDEDED